jgi:N-ethylmaleimide reductase
LLLEVVEAVVAVAGADKVGLRISPLNPFNDISDSDPQALFNHVAKALSPYNLAYLHVVEGGSHGLEVPDFDFVELREHFKGPYMANLGYDKESGNTALAEGRADLIAFGIPFIANPDLVERYAQNAPLNTADQNKFYGGDESGYIDYPTL